MSKNIENDVLSILIKDGVKEIDFENENNLISDINKIIINNKNLKSWSKRLINTDSNSATLICQNPGEGNRRHYHSNWNEWWYIIKGEWLFEIENDIHKIKQGQLILIKKNLKHKITATGKETAIRLAVSRSDVDHIYD
tara:strand:+ start:1098 stop:1514 length:417 start_codon:yes stop_codon:yes gene_type:complete